MALARVPPIGAWPGCPAPDESWSHRSDFPEPEVVVELCWASRKKDPVEYGYGVGWLVCKSDNGMSKWKNRRGETLLFNPDFWRPVS